MNRWLALTGVVAVLAIAGLMGAAVVTERTRSGSQPTFRQLTFRHGTIHGARLAADGQTVVYGATWIGAQPGLYVVGPGSPQSGSIGIGNAGIFSVSSRGDLAVAIGCRLNWGECIGTLAQVPITGGSPREMMKDVQVADWSPDGQNLAVVSFTGGKYRLEYPIGKVLYEPTGWITYARVSPQGDHIAFLDHPQLGDLGGSVSMLDLNGKTTVLSPNWKSLQGLAWSSSGNEVWFTGSRSGNGGSSALYAVTLAGRERTVFVSPGTLKLNDMTRDGERVLLTRGTTRGGIMSRAAAGAGERELSWFDYSTVADLSADGRTLLFYEWGEGVGARSTIFIRKTDGSDAIRLGEGRPLALSPDTRWALVLQETMPQQLVLLPTGTGDLKQLPRGTIVEYLDWAAWSRDGRRIFFAGRESGDVRRTYVQDVDGGNPRPITSDGFVGMLLSPDEHTVAAVDRYGEYYLCAVDERTDPRPLPGYRDGDVPLQWSADGRFLYVREAGNLVLRIYKLDLTTGSRQFWKEFVPPDPSVLIDIGSDPGQVRMTPDGNSYAYTYWTSEGELYLAQGLR
jgi:Tol biopolymer transport system component